MQVFSIIEFCNLFDLMNNTRFKGDAVHGAEFS